MQHPVKKRKVNYRKRRRLLVILLAIAVALSAAFVLLLPTIKAWYPVKTFTPPTLEMHQKLLASEDHTRLSAITVSQLDGDGYTLEYANGKLKLRRGGELLDISDAVEEEMLEAATTIAITDTVAEDAAEVEEQLGDMGLSPAQITVKVVYADGREVELQIGDPVPGTSYYYYRWSGDDCVYMCDVGINDVFGLSENLLLPIDQPVLVKTLMDEIRIDASGTESVLNFSTDTAGYTTGTLSTPYDYPLSGNGTEKVLTALENLRLGALEGPATQENRAGYGLDEPLCVLHVRQRAGAYTTVNEAGQLVAKELPGQQYRFVFGRAEGEYFYTCEYEGKVYLVSRFLTETLVGFNPSEWIARSPANMSGTALSAIVMQTGNANIDIRVNRAERVLPNNQLEVDEDGNLVYDVTATVNGEPMAQEQLDALVERLNAMTVSGDAPEGWTPGAASPRWRLTLTTTGGTVRTIAAYAMDAFADAWMVDGVIRHYGYVEALDTALGELVVAP